MVRGKCWANFYLVEVRERLEKTVHSFEIINERIIIKRIDKSLLTYGEIRIPNYLRDFFHFHEMEKHDRWDIEITYNHTLYYGVLYLDDYKRLRGSSDGEKSSRESLEILHPNISMKVMVMTSGKKMRRFFA